MNLKKFIIEYRNRLMTLSLLLLSITLWVLNISKVTTFTDLELWGFITGLWSIWLAVFNLPSNWAIGLINEAIFFIMFWNLGLFANAWLQVFFAIVSIYGWVYWLYGGKKRTEAPITYAGFVTTLGWALSTTFLTAFICFGMQAITGSYVLTDCLTTALSIIATYLLAKRKIENWIFWIIADVIYIMLFINQGIGLWAILYTVFILMCIKGIFDWRHIFSSAVNQAGIKLQDVEKHKIKEKRKVNEEI